MSYWCEKCQTLNYSGNKCSKCGHINGGKIPKEEQKIPKNNKMNSCVTCGNGISKNAKKCPHCGERSPQPIKTVLSNAITMLIALTILLIIFITIMFKVIMPYLTNTINNTLSHKQIQDPLESMNKNLEKIGINKIEAPNLISITPKFTKEQLCNKAWWAYFRKSSKIISDIQKENTKIKRKLGKRNIDYGTVLKQRIKPVKLNLSKLKKESCSQNYFNQLKQKEKRIKEVTQENVILKELMRVNYIK